MDEGKPYQNYEIFVTPDGVEHSSIVYKNVISNELHRWLLVARWDISDLVTAEKSLQEANRVNRLILNNANIGFAFIDPDYVIQWENISTYSSHPIICNYKTGTTCYKNVWGYDRPCQDCVMQLSFQERSNKKYFLPIIRNILRLWLLQSIMNLKNCKGW